MRKDDRGSSFFFIAAKLHISAKKYPLAENWGIDFTPRIAYTESAKLYSYLDEGVDSDGAVDRQLNTVGPFAGTVTGWKNRG